MKTSIQALIALVLVIIVVVGVYAAASGVFGNAGQNIEEGGDNAGSQLDCILGSPSNADEKCKTSSTTEVNERDVQKV